MSKFLRAQVTEPGMTLAAMDDSTRRFKGGGSSTASNEPMRAMKGAYQQYGQTLAGDPGTAAQPGYWSTPDSSRRLEQGDRRGSGEPQWVPGTPGTPGSGGFLNEYNPEWYQGKIQADIPDFLADAYSGYESSGRDPSSSTFASEQYNKDVLGGKYLGLSDPMRAAVMNPVMDSAASRFAAMGRYGSPASSQQMGLAGMQAMMPFYDAERSRQGQAAANLPAYDELRMERAKGAGDFYMGRQQRTLDDRRAGFEFDQNRFYDKMTKYGQLLSPGTQYGVQTTQAPGGSRAAGIAGGALSGASMGSAFGPYGTAAGAIIGGIGGAM